MRREDQKNRTRISPHLRQARSAGSQVISVAKIGYVRWSEFGRVPWRRAQRCPRSPSRVDPAGDQPKTSQIDPPARGLRSATLGNRPAAAPRRLPPPRPLPDPRCLAVVDGSRCCGPSRRLFAVIPGSSESRKIPWARDFAEHLHARGGRRSPEGRPGHLRAPGHRLTVPCVERDSASRPHSPSQIAHSALGPPSLSQNACSG